MRSQKFRSKRLKRRSRLQRGGGELSITFNKPTQDYKFDFLLNYNDSDSVVVTSVGDNTKSHSVLNQIKAGYVLKNMKINNQLMDINNITGLIHRLQDATPDDQIDFLFEHSSIPISLPTLQHTPKRVKPRFARYKFPLSVSMFSTISKENPSYGGKRSRKRRRTTRRH